MKFNVSILVKGKPVKIEIERVKLTDQIQQFAIRGKDKSVVIQNDQPLLNKVNMGSRRAPWKVVSGHISDAEVFTDVLRQIDHHLRNYKQE